MEKTEVMTHKHVSPALELLLLEFILIYVSNFPLPPHSPVKQPPSGSSLIILGLGLQLLCLVMVVFQVEI